MSATNYRGNPILFNQRAARQHERAAALRTAEERVRELERDAMVETLAAAGVVVPAPRRVSKTSPTEEQEVVESPISE